ncbi:hypothetical protein G7062_05690 [Erysipelothrix sp. HDW6C]|uniref:hypothetical protein n=1 Tax=Erysipelothrix sp. HDW6C TaxID=2714930 RepID=UPI00140BBDD4|nr:hypothetical protein [Erysipelothrix sp. HDW6C]QIK69817.1 hypothetical protein G7062_05690 [Erysipelothrix sp. HDW6C]
MKAPRLEKNKSFTNISFKSSLFIIFGILASTLIPKLLLDSLGLQLYPLRVILIALTSAFVVCRCLFFIDSNKGYTRGYWILFALIAILTGFISYFWVYQIYFV